MFSLQCLHKTWWSRDISIVSIIDTCGSPELSWAQSQVNIKHFFSCFGHSFHLGLARVIAELCHCRGWWEEWTLLNTAAESLNIPTEAEDGEHEHREEHPPQLLHVLRPDLPARLAVHEIQPQRPVLSLLPPLQDRLLVRVSNEGSRRSCKVLQSQIRPLPSPGWKRLQVLSHLRHYAQPV